MPVRVVLNTVYALMVKEMDAKDRREFDDKLYGFTEANDRANKALWGLDGSGSGTPDGVPAPAIGVSGVDD